MSKWDSELTKDQIEVAKETYKELYWKVVDVEYNIPTKQLRLILESSTEQTELYCFDVKNFKCLSGKTDEEIAEVSLLGERAIQWKNLDIQIGFEKFLVSVQLSEEWLESLR